MASPLGSFSSGVARRGAACGAGRARHSAGDLGVPRGAHTPLVHTLHCTSLHWHQRPVLVGGLRPGAVFIQSTRVPASCTSSTPRRRRRAGPGGGCCSCRRRHCGRPPCARGVACVRAVIVSVRASGSRSAIPSRLVPPPPHAHAAHFNGGERGSLLLRAARAGSPTACARLGKGGQRARVRAAACPRVEAACARRWEARGRSAHAHDRGGGMYARV